MTVAINEAVENARRFSAADAPQFIHSILDAIRRSLDGLVSNEQADDLKLSKEWWLL
jgi:hypothetical protein